MSNELSTFVYDSSDDFAGMDHTDKITPRAKLIQAMSPEAMQEDNPVPAGSWYDTSTQNILVPTKQQTQFLPLMMWKEWLEWNPDKKCPKEEKLLNKSFDPNGELAQMWRARVKVINSEGKEVNKVQEAYNLVVLLPELTGSYDEPFLFSFSKTQHYPMKQLMNSIQRLKIPNPSNPAEKIPSPIFGASWTFGSMRKTNDQNQTWYIPKFGPATILPAETLIYLAPIVQKLKEDRIKLMEQASSSHVDEPDTAVADQPNF